MICIKCGSRIKNKECYCHHCGAVITAKHKILFIAFLILIISAAITFVYAIFAQSENAYLISLALSFLSLISFIVFL